MPTVEKRRKRWKQQKIWGSGKMGNTTMVFSAFLWRIPKYNETVKGDYATVKFAIYTKVKFTKAHFTAK